MARARFVGPPNPGPDGEELGHDVPMLGRAVAPDELVDLPGALVAQVDGGWLMGPEDGEDGDPRRYLLPAGHWAVEDEPKPRRRSSKGEE